MVFFQDPLFTWGNLRARLGQGSELEPGVSPGPVDAWLFDLGPR